MALFWFVFMDFGSSLFLKQSSYQSKSRGLVENVLLTRRRTEYEDGLELYPTSASAQRI